MTPSLKDEQEERTRGPFRGYVSFLLRGQGGGHDTEEDESERPEADKP